MRIAFVITRSDAIGGATVHVRDLAAALQEMGHEPFVLLGGAGAVTAEFQAMAIPVVRLQHLRRAIHPWRDLLAVRELEQAIRRLNPDLVSAHTAKAGCLTRLACAGMSIPRIYTPHGWAITDRISRSQGMLFRCIERATAPLATTIVNVCDHERRLALDCHIGRPRQHKVIHNGMPDIPRSLRAKAWMAPPRIVMVARFEAPKDHLTLLEALAGLRNREWSLDLVGDGPLENAIRQRVRALDLAERVQFHGAVRNVAQIISAAQLFVLSSRSEGFPRSILEAMRAALPVVATDVGGVREAVTDGRTGYVVPTQSPETLRFALERLLADPVLRAEYGAAGREDYERRFTFARMLEQTLSIYEQVTGGTVEVKRPASRGADTLRGLSYLEER